MSVRAQTFLHSLRVTYVAAPDQLAEGLAGVLAEQSTALRAKYRYRGVFARADKILASPGRTWQLLQGGDRLMLDPEQIGECERCGENFVKWERSQRFCRKKCWNEHTVWLNARGRRAVQP